uniref:hypothetical protein n=1 Tax=Aeromonas salmonicida TaxID=645 RepID=UPI00215B1468|nr:hypothetical protein [Aeromonas salmonicida]
MERQRRAGLDQPRISALIARFTPRRWRANEKAAELGIAGVVSLTNLCTANNTVAIIVASKVARSCEHHGVTPRRAASMLDIFSCVYKDSSLGAQALLGLHLRISPLGGEHELLSHGPGTGCDSGCIRQASDGQDIGQITGTAADRALHPAWQPIPAGLVALFIPRKPC